MVERCLKEEFPKIRARARREKAEISFADESGLRSDFGASHDIEDIVNLIDGRPEIADEVRSAEVEVRSYLREEFDDLLASRFIDVISWHLGPQPEDQSRTATVIQRMRAIAGL